MTAQHSVIISWIAQWERHFVEPIVFGTTVPEQIASLIDEFCQKELGTAVADYLFYESSQGAVCGLRLLDGRRVVVKVHPSSKSLDFLQAVVRVQHHLLKHGYPCQSLCSIHGLWHTAWQPPKNWLTKGCIIRRLIPPFVAQWQKCLPGFFNSPELLKRFQGYIPLPLILAYQRE